MDKFNVGNIGTNALQTLAITGSNFARQTRALDRADMALNAKNDINASKLQEQQNKTDIQAEKLKQQKIKTEKLERKSVESPKQTTSIDEIMQDNSEQSGNIKQKIRNDIEWLDNSPYKKVGGILIPANLIPNKGGDK